MNKKSFGLIILITVAIETFLGIYIIGKKNVVSYDVVNVNECIKTVENNYGDSQKYSKSLDYTLIDNEGNVLYKTKEGIATTINEAIKKQDIIMDISVEGEIVGKILFDNETNQHIKNMKNSLIFVIVVISLVQLCVSGVFYLYLKRRIIKPFDDMKDFALRVANGNLDIPIMIDEGQVFGVFTESFDIMRSELKKARNAESKANADKKEMVAKLSHDIKTPVASIKSASEIGYELAQDDKTKKYFNLINQKADQITTLTDNLFNSSINDITTISVNPVKTPSECIKEIIESADYLNKATYENELPKCDIYIDKLRLLQAFDNVFMNSYKYANTPITISFEIKKEYLVIEIKDTGSGVSEEEIYVIKEKYKRGSNSSDKEGAGLGLYLTDYFLKRMEGELLLRDNNPGLKVLFCLRII